MPVLFQLSGYGGHCILNLCVPSHCMVWFQTDNLEGLIFVPAIACDGIPDLFRLQCSTFQQSCDHHMQMVVMAALHLQKSTPDHLYQDCCHIFCELFRTGGKLCLIILQIHYQACIIIVVSHNVNTIADRADIRHLIIERFPFSGDFMKFFRDQQFFDDLI